MSTVNSTTSSPRPTLGASDVGETYFETDSNKLLVWDGTSWNEWNHDQVITPGLPNNNFSLSVDGVDDYLDCGNIEALVGATGYSLAFWWKPAVSGESPSIAARQNISNYYALYKSSVAITTGGAGKAQTFTVPAGTDWRYYVLSYNAGAVFLQINGAQVLSASGFPSSLMTSTLAKFQIGRYTTYSGTTFNSTGLIDDVAVWSSALSATAATTLYNGGNPFDLTADSGNYDQASNLVAFWKMGDDSSDTSVGGSPSNGATVGGVQNIANPGTNNGIGTNGATYASKSADSNNVPY